jgi:hypothetical protein
MKTTMTLLALGLAAWISVPASAADEYPAGTVYPSESAPTDTDNSSIKSIEQEPAPAAGAPSGDASTPEVAPADNSMGGSDSMKKDDDSMNKSEDKSDSTP